MSRETCIKALYIICFLSFLISCKESTEINKKGLESKSKSTGTIYDLPPVDLETLTSRLYQNYHANPQSQAQIDENKIIDFAIKHKMDVTRDETGLYYLILEDGKGGYLRDGDPARCYYRGTLMNGDVFDTNMDTKELLEFRVGDLIYGWNVGLTKMRSGGKAIFLVPSGMAYGVRGLRGRIGRNEVLIFDLQTID